MCMYAFTIWVHGPVGLSVVTQATDLAIVLVASIIPNLIPQASKRQPTAFVHAPSRHDIGFRF